MESRLIVEGMGPWRNFDEIEEFLTIDELMLLSDSHATVQHNHYRMLGSFQGVDLGERDGSESDDGDELPPEILEHERKWQEVKRQAIESGEAARAELATFGLGYAKK